MLQPLIRVGFTCLQSKCPGYPRISASSLKSTSRFVNRTDDFVLAVTVLQGWRRGERCRGASRSVAIARGIRVVATCRRHSNDGSSGSLLSLLSLRDLHLILTVSSLSAALRAPNLLGCRTTRDLLSGIPSASFIMATLRLSDVQSPPITARWNSSAAPTPNRQQHILWLYCLQAGRRIFYALGK